MTPWISIVLVVMFGIAIGAGWRGAHASWKLHGKRIVTCPENGQPAAVDLAMWHLALSAAVSAPALQLRDCSRWRDRARCTQPCLRQIEAAPEDSLVSSMLSSWYSDKTCVFCGGAFGRLTRWEHQPCVATPDLLILEWKDVQPETIPSILATHAPVCRTCLVAETHIL